MNGLSMRPRVLVIAEAANPEWVSVPLVGWSLSRALDEVADVHLVTQVRNREAVLRAGLREGKDVTFIDSEAAAKPLWAVGKLLTGGKGKGWTTLAALATFAYPYFEKLVWRKFGSSILAGEWDIVHRVTPLSPVTPSPIAKHLARARVPFVLGPLNGGVPWPESFQAERRAEREWLSYVRKVALVLPGRSATYKYATAILAGSQHTSSEVPIRDQHKVIWLPENAVDPARFGRLHDRVPGPLRAVFIGRLVPYKGPDMALAAATPLLRERQMTFDIIGDGPMMDELRAKVTAEGIAEAVNFHGWLSLDQVAQVAGQTNVLLFPSIREFGGGAVIEAMALGLCPLVVDYAGPSELVTEGLGYKVPLGTRREIIVALRDRLQYLSRSPEEVAAIGARARDKVLRDFTWSAKARQVATVYDWVLGGARGTAPVPLRLESEFYQNTIERTDTNV